MWAGPGRPRRTETEALASELAAISGEFWQAMEMPWGPCGLWTLWISVLVTRMGLGGLS